MLRKNLIKKKPSYYFMFSLMNATWTTCQQPKFFFLEVKITMDGPNTRLTRLEMGEIILKDHKIYTKSKEIYCL